MRIQKFKTNSLLYTKHQNKRYSLFLGALEAASKDALAWLKERAVKALEPNAKRLLPQVHPGINHHSTRRIRCRITPLQEKRAAQALVTCIL
jgi:ABC-type phosphate/phosphonate transport system permease subunit